MQNKKPIKSRFLRISCPRCYSKQVVFGKSSSTIKCRECNLLLIKSTGGKAKIKAPVKKILWK